MTEENQVQPNPSEHHGGPSEMDHLVQLANRYGRPVLTGLVLALVLSIGLRVYRHNKHTTEQEALMELFRADATADLQSWVERYPDTDVAPLAQLRLASSQYNAGHFSQALETYETFLAENPKHLFAPIATLGVSQALEASGQIDTALAGFKAFLEQHPTHFLAPEAVLGKARCLAHQKRYDDARIACEDLIADKPDSEWSMRAEQTLRSVERMEKGIVPVAAPAAAAAWTLPGEVSREPSPAVLEIPALAPAADSATTAATDVTSGQTNPPAQNSGE